MSHLRFLLAVSVATLPLLAPAFFLAQRAQPTVTKVVEPAITVTHSENVIVIKEAKRVNFYRVMRPRPLDERLKFIEKYRLPLIESLMEANPDGSPEQALSASRNVLLTVGNWEILQENESANLLRAKAYELRLKGVIAERFRGGLDREAQERNAKAAENAFRNAVRCARKIADPATEVSVCQRYAGFLDYTGKTEQGEHIFQEAKSLVSRIQDVELEYYFKRIRPGRAESEYRLKARRMLEFLKGENAFTNALFLRGLVVRTKDPQRQLELWKRMHDEIDSSIDHYRSIDEHRHLAHALVWRSSMLLFNNFASVKDLLRIVGDAREARDRFKRALRVGRQIPGLPPMTVGWYESSATCATIEAQGLIRLCFRAEDGAPVPFGPLRRSRLEQAIHAARESYRARPQDADRRTVSQLLNSLGSAYVLLAQDPDVGSPRRARLVKMAARALRLADLYDAGTVAGIANFEEARRLVPASEVNKARAEVSDYGKRFVVDHLILEGAPNTD